MISSTTPYKLAEIIHDTCTPSKKDRSHLFSEISESSEIISNYFNSDLENMQNYEWSYNVGFGYIVIEKNIWINEPILDLINKKFPIFVCTILKMEKNNIYEWHRDTDRGVCINMLLTHDHFSKCFFYDEKKIITLDYKPNKFYLFNNQKFHKIKNYEKTRYIFSVSFVDKKDKLDYNTVYDWMNTKNLIVK
jgi:hypothetical protein